MGKFTWFWQQCTVVNAQTVKIRELNAVINVLNNDFVKQMLAVLFITKLHQILKLDVEFITLSSFTYTSMQ